MVTEKTWDEFRNCGLLWLINQTLHVFGWAICLDVEDGKVKNAYPARVKFRGFDESNNTKGYQKVTDYLKNNIDELSKETME